MGAEQSQTQIPELSIEEKAVEVSDYWSLYSANLENAKNVSVFIGERYVNGSLWALQTPLNRNIKNLMIYRHPCILKYISSWHKNSKQYLVVEEAFPLSHIVNKLDVVQISIGLLSVLKALHFLHQNALTSHNNVCLTAIYITSDGNWKLGGMEYLCHYNEVGGEYMQKIQGHRFDKAVDPNEGKLLNDKSGRRDFIDVYAFSVLSLELLRNKTDDQMVSLATFRAYCENEMQSSDLILRPSFKTILEHDFFNHDFVLVHTFLVELPLKSDMEKSQFFQTLPKKLATFDEEIVASQLGGLLLSRLTLLNKSAQSYLLPLILTTRSDRFPTAIFSDDTFKKFLGSRVLEIFKVRDAQIRSVLLEHFSNFVHTFTKEELQFSILPELLVGIKDTSDSLVALTLRNLADLVPILGASIVIGGKRAKLFNDGRPTSKIFRRCSQNVQVSEAVVVSPNIETLQLDETNSVQGVEINHIDDLPERPRPDGEEETSNDDVAYSVDEDMDNWEDWEMNDGTANIENKGTQSVAHENCLSGTTECSIFTTDEKYEMTELGLKRNVSAPRFIIPDISELDIRNQLKQQNDDVDFFRDMEPIIDKSNKFVIGEVSNHYIDQKVSNNLELKTAGDIEDGWEDWE